MIQKRHAARAALVLFSLGLSLVAGEFALRWIEDTADDPGSDDDWYVRYRRMNETIYQRSDDPVLVYEPVPGASVPMEYGPARFDEGAMRGSRNPAREPDGRTRVAIVGDSLVWGEFLAEGDAIPRQTRRALPDSFEVLGFGVTGYDTAQEALWYERAVRPYHPNVVVVVFCMNDMMIMSGPFERFASDEDRARKTAQEAWVAQVAPLRRETIDGVLDERLRGAPSRLLARAFGLFERWRFDRDYVDEYLVAFEEETWRTRTDGAIARLGAAVAEDDARGIFVISPVLEAWDDYHWMPIHEHVAERARAAGFAVLDPLDRWREETDAETMRVGGDNLHYGRRGSRRFASTLAEAIEEAR